MRLDFFFLHSQQTTGRPLHEEFIFFSDPLGIIFLGCQTGKVVHILLTARHIERRTQISYSIETLPSSCQLFQHVLSDVSAVNQTLK